jgi:hypothetical protein
VPHRQWCFTDQKGTHWHTFPVEAFAPMYHFVRDQARHLDGFEAVEGLKLTVPPGVLHTVRRKDKTTVVHLLNLDYDSATGRVRERRNVSVGLPKALVAGDQAVQVLSYDGGRKELALQRNEEELQVTVPVLGIWQLVVIE